MSISPDSVALRDTQHSQLWSLAALACFTGVINKQQLRVRWNPSLRKIYGLSASQSLRGGPLNNNRILTAELQRIQQACDDLIAHNKPINLKFKIQVDGTVKLVRAIAERVNHSNRVSGILQQCAEKQDEPVLMVSQRRWQSVGRLTLLDEVTSAMAHELNQPLAAISMFAQVGGRMLASPEPPLDKVRQVFHDVSQQALRAGDLIHHMRSLVKRQPSRQIRLSVTELVRGFASLAEPMARTHHVEFTVPAEFPAEFVEADVAHINQVLSILFHNALDAVNSNELTRKSIAITTEMAEEKIVIAIMDSGKGIAESASARLFQPFFSTKENGTGLGLISARNILEIYGSHLQFTNLRQGGCRFWFALPVAQSM